jgi:hypothetical protein
VDELEEIFGITGDDATDFAIIKESENDTKQPDSKGTGCLGVMLLLCVCLCFSIWLI